MADKEILPSPNCFEFRVNNYHLHGINSCKICIEHTQNKNIDQVKQQYQEQILKNQKDFILKEDIDETNDPEVMMELYEIFKDCECCKGFVFACEGQFCQILGKCYCYQKKQQDNIMDN